MKKIILWIWFRRVFIATIFSCSVAIAQNSKNSLDWAGTYKGPRELFIVLNINTDLTYTELIINSNDNDTTELQGTFTWNKAGNEIRVSNNNIRYRVQENKLVAMHGKEILYTLYKEKKDINDITEKYWKLIEINSNPVVLDENNREPYLILKKENSRVTGFGGCNNFNGSYNLERMNKIQFSKMVSTKIFCLNNMEIEQQLYQAFETADNYTLSEDGKYLSLNKGRMTPLARFEVVYLR